MLKQYNYCPTFLIMICGFTTCIMSLMKYYSLHAGFYDFGHYANIIWNVAQNIQNWPLFFTIHVQPLLFILVPFYQFGGVPLLLVINAIVIWYPFVFMFKLIKDKKQNFLILASLLLFWPIWYNALFDFRIDNLILLFSSIFYLFVLQPTQNKSYLVPFLCAIGCLFVKETYALLSLFMGIYLIIKKRWWITGISIAIISIIYFIITTQYLLPNFPYSSEHAVPWWANSFNHLGASPVEAFVNCLSKPLECLKSVPIDILKLKYFVFLMVPFGIICIFGLIELVPAIPLLAISFLSANPAHYGIGHQYTIGTIIPITVSFIVGLPRLIDTINNHYKNIDNAPITNANKIYTVIISTIFITSVMSNIVISPSPISRLFITDKVWQYGWKAYILSERYSKIKQMIHDLIQNEPTYMISTQNTLSWGPIIERKFVTTFPNGVNELHDLPCYSQCGYDKDLNRTTNRENIIYKKADLVLIDYKRPLYLNEIGCDWLYGKCNNSEIRERFNAIVRSLSTNYKICNNYDSFYIYERKR